LRTLDLRENELGDIGADKISHMMMDDLFISISVLYLQRNGIGNKGVKKLVNMLRAIKDVHCPKLSNINIEENLATAAVKRDLRPLPPGVSL